MKAVLTRNGDYFVPLRDRMRPRSPTRCSLIAGAAYGWAVKPYAAENAYLRLRQDFVESLERRMLQLTPAERRQVDTLLKGALPK